MKGKKAYKDSCKGFTSIFEDDWKEKKIGSCTFIESDGSNHFKYLFIAIGSCLKGFS